jgi:predicted ATPase/DNA-binding SARP family transcriptional activator
VELRVLGAVEAVGPRGVVPLGGPRQRLLLAALLANRRQVVSIDALTDVLWGENPPPTARPTLQTSISKLRRQLDPITGVELETRPPGYTLIVNPEAVDADRFEALVSLARRLMLEHPREALGHLDEGLGLWFGDAFGGFSDLPWAAAEAVRLEELRWQAVEDRMDVLLDLGADSTLVGELDGLTQTEPLRERLRRQHVLALYRSGRQGEALRVATQFRAFLAEELGLDPSPDFVELERAVAVGDDMRGSTAPPVGLERMGPLIGTTSQLPAATVSLVGRDDVVEDLVELVGQTRLVTLTGPGGVGKSSVALEVARRNHDRFRDGVRLIELAPITTPEDVATAVAHAVDAERRAGRSITESIAEVLAPLELLLFVDNCEHVIEESSDVIAHLLRWCPSLSVLTTSREPTGLSGEVVRTIAPLEVPSDVSAPAAALATTPAVSLFIARAQDATPSFEFNQSNAHAVAELCTELDGIPLALELAAARMGSMSPRQLADRLHERFALLAGVRGRETRHRSLLEVVQWSYGLLSADEQDLLARLSVFVGSFDLDAVEATSAENQSATGQSASTLASLVSKSLLSTVLLGDQLRYTQLETLRQFGAARLAERPDALQVHRAHVAVFTDRVRRAATEIDGPDERAWAALLESDTDNIRSAFNTAIAVGNGEAAITLVTSVAEHGFRSIRYEVVDWAETLVGSDLVDDHPDLPTALGVAGYGAFVRGEFDRAAALANQAVELRERIGATPCGLPERVLSNALFYMGEHDAAVDWMERMADCARSLGRRGRLAHALYMRSVAATSLGDPQVGVSLAQESLDAAASSASPTALAQATYATGFAIAADQPARAVDLLDEAAALAESVGNRWMRAFAMTEATWLRAKRGDLRQALAGCQEVVTTWFRGGDWANQWLSLRHIAGILALQHHDEAAAILSGAVDAAGARSALPFSPVDAVELDELSLQLADRVGTAAVTDARRRGALMHDDAVIALALEAIASTLGR